MFVNEIGFVLDSQLVSINSIIHIAAPSILGRVSSADNKRHCFRCTVLQRELILPALKTYPPKKQLQESLNSKMWHTDRPTELPTEQRLYYLLRVHD